MKKIILLLASILLIPTINAQSVPSGMKYQAVARDLSGVPLVNETITIKIDLQSNEDVKAIHYTEVHSVKTNQFGLFSIVIGDGQGQRGKYNEIPWSKNNIWMEISILNKRSNEFAILSNSKLLAVPYAYHAFSADELSTNTRKPGGGGGGGGTDDGAPSQAWLLFGNSKTDPTVDKFGTTDDADLVFVTNNQERFRITADGQIKTGSGKFTIGGNLEVQGDRTQINKDLFVGRNVELNFDPALGGETINHGDFTVKSNSLLEGLLNVNSDTDLDAKLNVDGTTDLNDALMVNNNAKSTLTGELQVDGITNLNEALNVNNAMKTTLSGELQVDGLSNLNNGLNVNNNKPTLLTGSLAVNGSMTLNNVFNVVNDNSNHVATFTNSNTGNGDGIKIKLSKTHPAWDGGAYINIPNPAVEFLGAPKEIIKGYFNGNDFNFADLLNLVPSAVVAGTLCNLVEKLSEKLNDELGLPAGVAPLTDATIFDAVNSFADILIDDDWRPDNPTTIVPGFTLEFPEDFCPDFLPSLSMPNINPTSVDNSLTNDNHFIDFSDKDNRTLGYIRAVSINEHWDNFFTGLYATNFIQKTVGVDPLDGITGAIREISYIIDAYNSIGVEYVSGNGDYAEWLERKNPEEIITKGDIVGVIGGKITKKLEGAEQIMAISEKPIMLGNVPEKNKEYLGNNVAFMGQIPVKLMGHVKTGDYIIANSKIPGYGIAKSPDQIKIEDTKFIVGRSWETNLNDGPKMVNTVIGIHNGDYLKIIKDLQNKVNASENRLSNLESKVDILLGSTNH